VLGKSSYYLCPHTARPTYVSSYCSIYVFSYYLGVYIYMYAGGACHTRRRCWASRPTYVSSYCSIHVFSYYYIWTQAVRVIPDAGAGQVVLHMCPHTTTIYGHRRYVSYPTQVLGKSCKMVPVFLMGILIGVGGGGVRILCVLLLLYGDTY
jgi:hypothetical protein